MGMIWSLCQPRINESSSSYTSTTELHYTMNFLSHVIAELNARFVDKPFSLLIPLKAACSPTTFPNMHVLLQHALTLLVRV